ncbi:MAG: hypothetical protein ACE5KF_01090 [Kiloniellaceae bacterium]
MEIVVTKTRRGPPNGLPVGRRKEGGIHGPESRPPMPGDPATAALAEGRAEPAQPNSSGPTEAKNFGAAPENKALMAAPENKALMAARENKAIVRPTRPGKAG